LLCLQSQNLPPLLKTKGMTILMEMSGNSEAPFHKKISYMPSLWKAKKEVARQANHGSRPLTQHQTPWYQAPYHQAPRYQAPWSHAPRYQASQHQQPQQRFLPDNHSGKSKIKSKHLKSSQKVEDDQYYREPPIWMQSMMEWMGQQKNSCQPLEGKLGSRRRITFTP
jgi:hypothetical protein